MSYASAELHVVTGAFGYTGRHIARCLLAAGHRVRTLTSRPPDRRNPFRSQIEVAPLDFRNIAELRKSLEGAAVLYNTYWVRFDYGQATFERAIANTRTLIEAAEQAGIRRIVHLSVTNPSGDSPLPYFRGKAMLEQAIRQSKLSYAILRPTEIFGSEDILINNIAWLLRRAPLFAIPGSGDYRLQPVFVEDVAELAIRAAAEVNNIVLDVVGPEVFTFDALVRLLAESVGSSAKIIHVPPRLALFFTSLLGYTVRDVVLTREELAGLMADLLVSAGPPTGQTHFSAWLKENGHTVGSRYVSELVKHYR